MILKTTLALFASMAHAGSSSGEILRLANEGQWKDALGKADNTFIKSKDVYHDSLLHIAVRQNMLKPINDLLKRNPKYKEDTNIENQTALHIAAKNDDVDKNGQWQSQISQIVIALVKANANIEAKDEDGLTPLLMAAKSHNCHTFVTLIELGANVNTRSFSETMEILISSSIDTDKYKRYETFAKILETRLNCTMNHITIKRLLRTYGLQKIQYMMSYIIVRKLKLLFNKKFKYINYKLQ